MISKNDLAPDVVNKLHLLETMLYQEPFFLIRRIQRIVGNRETAEDLSQDALLHALHGLPGFRGEGEQAQLRLWLDRIARNLAYNYLRDQGRRPGQESLEQKNPAGHSLAELLLAKSSDPEFLSSQAEAYTYLTEMIQELPAPVRTVFLLRQIEGISTAVTATTLHISEDLVKWRLQRARKLLREQLLAARDISFSI